MITLPKTWADSLGLKKNDPVNVAVQPNGGLLLTANSSQSSNPEPKHIDLDGMDTPVALYRCLIGAYIAGHDQILVRSSTPIKGSFLEVISEFTQTSMGMEIIEEEEDRILIKDLIDHADILPQKNVRREYILVKRMMSDVFSEDPPSMKDMVMRDTEIDRIHWLVQRQSSIHQQDISLSFKMGIRLKDIISCMGVSKILERMGDHAVLISKNLQGLEESEKGDVQSKLAEISPVLQKYFEDAMGSWFDAEHETAENVLCNKTAVLRNIQNVFNEVTGFSASSLIFGSCIRLVEYCTDLAESAINLAMAKE